MGADLHYQAQSCGGEAGTSASVSAEVGAQDVLSRCLRGHGRGMLTRCFRVSPLLWTGEGMHFAKLQHHPHVERVWSGQGAPLRVPSGSAAHCAPCPAHQGDKEEFSCKSSPQGCALT